MAVTAKVKTGISQRYYEEPKAKEADGQQMSQIYKKRKKDGHLGKADNKGDHKFKEPLRDQEIEGLLGTYSKLFIRISIDTRNNGGLNQILEQGVGMGNAREEKHLFTSVVNF